MYVDEEAAESVAVFRVAFRNSEEGAEFRDAHERFARQSAASAIEIEGALTIERRSGAVTVLLPAADGREALFVIGSSETAALAAARALQGG